ncbi:MAG: hypothetical protein IGBAC_1984 [Ignavibacteriae bacterium]|nr:MAG: hypothetical protein IGBAC_1984 [Ignavibacteriota bacterium]
MKKFWVSFIAVFIAMVIINALIHSLILGPTYQSAEMKNIWRTDMQAKMWIYYIVYLITSFFFVLIFSKGYTGKGIIEGVRYGIYIGFLMSVPMAYATYAMIPIPYSIAVQWFIYGMIQYIILGIIVAAIYGKHEQKTS